MGKHKHHAGMKMTGMNHDEHAHHASVEEMEMRSWKRKMVGSWMFAIPVAILMILDRVFGIDILPMGWMIPTLLVLGFPVVFVFGWSTIRGGLRGFYTFYFNMDSLIALGTVVAYLTGFFR